MREKLIELLEDVCASCDIPIDVDEDGCGTYEIEGADYIADFLIANGVTVQKRGRWEKYGYKWKCNNCLEKINIDGTPEENGLYYCPNCGADMRGEEHESD